MDRCDVRMLTMTLLGPLVVPINIGVLDYSGDQEILVVQMKARHSHVGPL